MEFIKDNINEQEQWSEIMELAKKYGFLVQAYGGVATLALRSEQISVLGKEKHELIQEANGRAAL